METISNADLKELLLQYNISNQDIKGSGKLGRILKSDRLKIYKELQNRLIKPLTMTDILLPTYLVQLDYTDLRNLCRTSKDYNLCDNDVIFKMNVAQLLKTLDNQIEKLMNVHYFELPSWVNVELFMIGMKKKIYYNLAENINMTFDENLIKGKLDKDRLNKDGSLIVK